MASFLSDLFSRLVGKGSSQDGEGPSAEPVLYKDYRIRPAPYSAKGQFQTAGIIEKDFPDGVREHRFVRAETHASRDDAMTFSITKAKQIIDEQGDRIFPDKPAATS
ncbi:HlyU family transcriptional regulator [Microvirga rosea]|uniref:HlyU family transcriptional regulator n=1 Tax=Microvirga rosea TaxID=2715425 RepID=UPI001D09FFC4|nr:HlyU family transcriptional regulator [Microvirga rosea]MCB8819568.1 hypothetical protein [Microvirga rosea]